MRSCSEISYFLTILYIVVAVSHTESNDNCSLETRDDLVNQTFVQTVKAQCKYQHSLDRFYFLISWDLPSSHKSKVKRFRISIKYGQDEKCFKADSDDRSFEFYETDGFRKDDFMFYAVTAEPVPKKSVSVVEHKSVRCPVKPKLKTLPNKLIEIGDSFTFYCLFEENPEPDVEEIRWRFSNDSENCKHGRYIRPDKHYTISHDNRELKISNVKDIHFGCYLVTAESVVGDAEEQRGFLRPLRSPKKHENDDASRLSIVLITILIIFSCLLAITCGLFIRYRQRKRFHVTATPPVRTDKTKKVYISHCCDKSDQDSILKLAQVINEYDNLEAIIDLCNQVPINNMGLPCWITNNMESCDKILLIFTPQYLSLVRSYLTNQQNNTYEDLPFIHNTEDKTMTTAKKINLEYSIIDNLLFQQSQKSKNLVIVSKDVKSKDFPLQLQNKMHFKFPTKLNIQSEEDLDDNFLKIIGVLSDQEPFQLCVDDKVSPYQRL